MHSEDEIVSSHLKLQPQVKTTQARPARSQIYPWYDSFWLNEYSNAKRIIRKIKPGALAAFEDAMQIFRTRPDFHVTAFKRLFDDTTMEKIRQVVRNLKATDFELYEARQFKRLIVHDQAYFTELQHQLVPLVSEAAGELVEPHYNFLSLYSATGICPVHMDSPEAKWTIDLCLNQSEPWPIWLSQIQTWPEVDVDSEANVRFEGDWEQAIRHSPSLGFEAYSMEPGQAILFSGSSQWHYRNSMPTSSKNSFCDLLFLHFIPCGTLELSKPKNWAKLFNIPELNKDE